MHTMSFIKFWKKEVMLPHPVFDACWWHNKMTQCQIIIAQTAQVHHLSSEISISCLYTHLVNIESTRSIQPGGHRMTIGVPIVVKFSVIELKNRNDFHRDLFKTYNTNSNVQIKQRFRDNYRHENYQLFIFTTKTFLGIYPIDDSIFKNLQQSFRNTYYNSSLLFDSLVNWHKGREVMQRNDNTFSCTYFSLFGRCVFTEWMFKHDCFCRCSSQESPALISQQTIHGIVVPSKSLMVRRDCQKQKKKKLHLAHVRK